MFLSNLQTFIIIHLTNADIPKVIVVQNSVTTRQRHTVALVNIIGELGLSTFLLKQFYKVKTIGF